MSELKPCPFCGGTKICTEKGINLNYCDNCSAESNIEHWNIRPIEDTLNKRIAELEAEIDQLAARWRQERQDDKWIPVSERLPDNWESVLTIDISKSTRDMVTAFYNPETSLWSTHFSCDLWVTHWMPLPASPIVYGKESEE